GGRGRGTSSRNGKDRGRRRNGDGRVEPGLAPPAGAVGGTGAGSLCTARGPAGRHGCGCGPHRPTGPVDGPEQVRTAFRRGVRRGQSEAARSLAATPT